MSCSIWPEAIDRTFSNLELHMLYTSPRNDPSSWAGSVASTARPRVRALDSLCSHRNALHKARAAMLLSVSWTGGTLSAASRADNQTSFLFLFL